jgi:hypothetical protein
VLADALSAQARLFADEASRDWDEQPKVQAGFKSLRNLLNEASHELRSQTTSDEIIKKLEALGFGWSLDHVGKSVRVRLWIWEKPLGVYEAQQVLPLGALLTGAILEAQKYVIPETNCPPAHAMIEKLKESFPQPNG